MKKSAKLKLDFCPSSESQIFSLGTDAKGFNPACVGRGSHVLEVGGGSCPAPPGTSPLVRQITVGGEGLAGERGAPIRHAEQGL